MKVEFEPTFRSFFTNLGGRPSYTVEVFKSSTLVIRATGHFAKIDDTNCGMWAVSFASYAGRSLAQEKLRFESYPGKIRRDILQFVDGKLSFTEVV